MTPDQAILNHAIRIQHDGLPHAPQALEWGKRYAEATLEALELKGELSRPEWTRRELSLGSGNY